MLINKHFFLLLCLSAWHVSTLSAQAPNLGSAFNFAIFTSSGAVNNAGATAITGDIGTHVGAFNGFPPGIVFGSVHVADAVAAQAAADVENAYNSLTPITCGLVLGVGLGNNQILTPNVYCVGGAATLTGDLILDGQGNANSIFIIKINGEFSTAILSKVLLINNADLCNVYWQINGAVNMGAVTAFRGNILADGAISMASGASLIGRALTRAGALNLDNNALTLGLEPLPAAAIASGPTSFCVGDSIVLSGNINGTWNTGATTPTIVVKTSGTYFIVNTTACSSVNSNSIVVSVETLPICSILGDNTVCPGFTTNLIATTGLSAYLWNSGSTNAALSNVGPGTYTVTVTNINACTSSCSMEVQANPQLNIQCNSTAITTPGGMTGTLEAASLTPVSSYLWSNGAQTANQIGVGAGTYTVTVTDLNGCTSTCNTIINPVPCALMLNTTKTNVSCAGGNNGQANVTVNGAFLGFTVLWSNGVNTALNPNLMAGTYTVTITDGANCVSTASVNITQAAVLLLTCSATSIIGNGTGSANVSVSGGTLPYSYLWSNGGASASITGLQAGTYTVTVTDQNGCTATCDPIINAAPCALTLNTTKTNVSCAGGNNGQANVTVNGAFLGFSVLWSNGVNTALNPNLMAGTYTVTITDGANCVSTASVNITQAAVLLLTCSATSIIGNGTGSANVSVSGGTLPYSYLWSNGGNSSSITGLQAGTYTVTVTDQNACTATCDPIINAAPCALTLNTTKTNVSCAGGNNGQANVTVNGAFLGFTVLWSNGVNTALNPNLMAGTYTVTITDGANCVSTASVNITQAAVLLLTCSATSIIGNGTGSANVSVSGGTLPYSYLWSNGGTSSSISGLQAGTYTVTITDQNACTATCSTIINPVPCSSLTIKTTKTNISCFGGNNGQANVIVNGATSGFSVLWSNGVNTALNQNLVAGTYTVTITDGTGCSLSKSVSIGQPTPLLLDCSTILIPDCLTSIASITVSGGTFPYAYLWSNGATSNIIVGLTNGAYTVTVTDAKLCTSTCSVVVNDPPAPVCTLVNNTITTLGFFGIVGQSGPYYLPASTGLTLTDNLFEGVIYNKLDSNERWDVHFVLKNKQTAAQWLASGEMLQMDPNGCATADHTNWVILEIDPALSTLTGQGEFAGQLLNIHNMGYANGDTMRSFIQYGMGAGVIDCGYGISAWFGFEGSQSGTSDFYALLDCSVLVIDPPAPVCTFVNNTITTLGFFGIVGQSGPYYLPASTGLTLNDNLFEGVIYNKLDSNERWDVHFVLKNKQTAAQWLASGEMLQMDPNGCATADHTDWVILEIDPALSTLTGQGEFAGQLLNIHNMGYANGDTMRSFIQYGMGAGVIDCGYGISAWFGFEGSQTGTSDFYALLDCNDTPLPQVTICEINANPTQSFVLKFNNKLYRPSVNSMKLVRSENGTAVLQGIVRNKLDLDDKFLFTLRFSSTKTYSEWLSAGNLLNTTNCTSANQVDWSFLSVQAAGSSLIGMGINTGINANISLKAKNGIAIGEGATGYCGFGLGGRFQLTGGINATAVLHGKLSNCTESSCSNNDLLGCISTIQPLQSESDTSEESSVAIKCYPNPTYEWLTIELAGLPAQWLDISISNLNGQFVSQEKVYFEDAATLNLKSLLNGVYLLQITGDNTDIYTERIVILK